MNSAKDKQEKIREGIAQRAAWYFRGGDKIQPEDYEFTDGVIQFEDSQGVVIKGMMLLYEGKPVGYEVEPLIEGK